MPDGGRSRPIVVGVDGSSGSRPALAWAVAEARLHGVDLEAVYVYEVPELGCGIDQVAIPDSSEATDDLRVLIDTLVPSPPAGPDVAVRLHSGIGRPEQVLSTVARELNGTMLVVGARSGAYQALLGPVALGLARSYGYPLVVVPDGDGQRSGPGRIVVGVDGTGGAGAALQWAAAEAALRRVTLDAVIAWTPPGAQCGWPRTKGRVPVLESIHSILDRAVEGVDGPAVEVRRHVCEGPASELLLRQAEGAQLLVVGAHQDPTRHDDGVTSVSASCAAHAGVPVAIIPTTVAPGYPLPNGPRATR